MQYIINSLVMNHLKLETTFLVLANLTSNNCIAKIRIKHGPGLPAAHSQESAAMLSQHLQSKNSDISIHITQVKLFVHFEATMQTNNFEFCLRKWPAAYSDPIVQHQKHLCKDDGRQSRKSNFAVLLAIQLIIVLFSSILHKGE